MNVENGYFEEKGLKIDKERVLTFSKIRCPLECKYCFADDLNIEIEGDGTYLSKEQLDLLKKLPEEVKLIMLGCDTEFFLNKRESLETINELAKFGRDISVVTKLPLSKDFIQKLSHINEEIGKSGNVMSISVSIACLESAQKWEPKAPNPELRIETLKSLHDMGIKTMTAIRPLLPDISNEEIEQIILSTKDFCDGYYSGPLYLKRPDQKLLGHNLSELKIEEIKPHWMPDNNTFYKIEKYGQMEFLRQVVKKYGKNMFEGAAEGIKYLKNEKH